MESRESVEVRKLKNHSVFKSTAILKLLSYFKVLWIMIFSRQWVSGQSARSGECCTLNPHKVILKMDSCLMLLPFHNFVLTYLFPWSQCQKWKKRFHGVFIALSLKILSSKYQSWNTKEWHKMLEVWRWICGGQLLGKTFVVVAA